MTRPAGVPGSAQAASNRETIVYRRVIRFDGRRHLFHVQDYHEN